MITDELRDEFSRLLHTHVSGLKANEVRGRRWPELSPATRCPLGA
jgi:hypothetical protein